MKTSCILLILFPHLLAAQISIESARQTKIGTIVTVRGVVTGSFGELSFIQDNTAGIAVYGTLLTKNDSVSVTGELTKFNGMIEIVISSAMVLGPDTPVKPRIVNSILSYEGQLVTLQNVRFQKVNTFFYPQRRGQLIRNQDTIQYWIDENTNIPGYQVPTTNTTVTGIVGRFGNYLQLIPRTNSDIVNSNIQQLPTSNNFKVLNWNLEFFGAERFGPTNDELQLTNVARVLNEIHPDIAALQEVSNDQAFKDLVKQLPGYEGRCSNRYSYFFDPSDDFPPQKLCFVYNLSTVKIIREKILFRKLFDENPSDLFSSGRLPCLLEAESRGQRIALVNIHGKSGATANDRSRRLIDAQLLKDTLDAYYSNRDLILLGDFNDDVDKSISPGLQTPYINFTNDDKYTCISSTLSEQGWHSTIAYDDMIDHQVISRSLSWKYVDGSVRIVNPFNTVMMYGKTTSDHLPIISEFDLNSLISLTENTESAQEIQVYPNPTKDLVWIDTAAEISVINSLGQVIIKTKGAQSPISLGKYAPGIYTVLFENRTVRILRN